MSHVLLKEIHKKNPSPDTPFPLYILLLNISKSKNVGNIVRTAAAFDISAFFLIGDKRLKRLNLLGNRGTAKRMRYMHFDKLNSFNEFRKTMEIELLGVEIDERSIPLHEYEYRYERNGDEDLINKNKNNIGVSPSSFQLTEYDETQKGVDLYMEHDGKLNKLNKIKDNNKPMVYNTDININTNIIPMGGVCLIFGSEGSGIHPNHLKLCDRLVHIPQYSSKIACLNVSIAASIVMYHITLLRGLKEAEMTGQKYQLEMERGDGGNVSAEIISLEKEEEEDSDNEIEEGYYDF